MNPSPISAKSTSAATCPSPPTRAPAAARRSTSPSTTGPPAASTRYTCAGRTTNGATWTGDLHTIANAKNPALAINDAGKVAFLYQRLDGTGAGQQWVTVLEQ